MPRERNACRAAPGRAAALLASLVACALAGGCATSGAGREAPKTELLKVPSADGEAARLYLADLADLAASPPARQAEILKGAHDLAESAPTTTNRLRYALMLADPGHGGADPVAARRQLSEILARPEWALPSERSLASLALRSTEARLALAEDTRRSGEAAANRDHDKLVAATRRLAVEQDENARLKKALEEAQKKLDAVSQLERAAKERGNAPGGTQ